MFSVSVTGQARLAGGFLRRRFLAIGRDDQTGAITVLVASTLGAGVLLGAAALTMDTGALLYERSQLQNGADAAALSIARSCASPTPCAAPDISASSSLSALTGANAADQKSKIATICGSAALVAANPTAFPAQCATLASPALVECPNTTSAAKYVEARTETLNTDGSTILPPMFAQTLVGAGTQYSRTTVKACGRVGWGPARTTRGFVLPVAMSYCEWKSATGADPPSVPGTYVTPPDYSGGVTFGYDALSNTSAPDWPTAPEREVYTASSVPSPGCTTWNGHVSPGNFSAVEQTSTCAAVAGEWMVGNTGNDSPCTDNELAPYRGKLILVPLFDCVAASTAALTPTTDCQAAGSNANYHITGYGTFYLTGWQFSGTNGDYDNSVKDGHQLCHAAGTTGNSGRCFSGWFTRQVIGVGEIDDTGAPDFGTTVIQALG